MCTMQWGGFLSMGTRTGYFDRAGVYCRGLILNCLSFFFNIKHIPFSGRNPVFQETLDVKPHVLILNKMDLTDLSNKQVSSLAAISAAPHVISNEK